MAKPVPKIKKNRNRLILKKIKFTRGIKAEGGPSHYEKVPLLFWENIVDLYENYPLKV